MDRDIGQSILGKEYRYLEYQRPSPCKSIDGDSSTSIWYRGRGKIPNRYLLRSCLPSQLSQNVFPSLFYLHSQNGFDTSWPTQNYLCLSSVSLTPSPSTRRLPTIYFPFSSEEWLKIAKKSANCNRLSLEINWFQTLTNSLSKWFLLWTCGILAQIEMAGKDGSFIDRPYLYRKILAPDNLGGKIM